MKYWISSEVFSCLGKNSGQTGKILVIDTISFVLILRKVITKKRTHRNIWAINIADICFNMSKL